MAGKIFVNYRRDDERAMAARIRDRLAAVFGDASVFMDVDNLMAGQRFDKELKEALGQTDMLLAVIGPRWLELFTERQASGERDYVREEIAGALQRGLVVIPVLIERAPLPRADELPEDIRDLVLHQKHVVTHEQFGRDVAGLVEAIRFARKTAGAQTRTRGAAATWTAVAIVAALMLGGGLLAYRMEMAAWIWSAPEAGIAGDTENGGEGAAPSLTERVRKGGKVALEKAKKVKRRWDDALKAWEHRDHLEPGALPDLVMGDADAPVTIIEYASMTCPHCARFHNDVLPVLKRRYIDKGHVRLVFREFPLDESAMLASMAARCAGTGKALRLISILFARQDEWSRSKSLDEFRDKLFALGQELGLTRQAFDACVPATKELSARQQKLVSDIEKVRARAKENYGVRATPTFFINGRKRVGGTVEDFEKAIEPLIRR